MFLGVMKCHGTSMSVPKCFGPAGRKMGVEHKGLWRELGLRSRNVRQICMFIVWKKKSVFEKTCVFEGVKKEVKCTMTKTKTCVFEDIEQK
jgi:hypothetical protein